MPNLETVPGSPNAGYRCIRPVVIVVRWRSLPLLAILVLVALHVVILLCVAGRRKTLIEHDRISVRGGGRGGIWVHDAWLAL